MTTTTSEVDAILGTWTWPSFPGEIILIKREQNHAGILEYINSIFSMFGVHVHMYIYIYVYINIYIYRIIHRNLKKWNPIWKTMTNYRSIFFGLLRLNCVLLMAFFRETKDAVQLRMRPVSGHFCKSLMSSRRMQAMSVGKCGCKIL